MMVRFHSRDVLAGASTNLPPVVASNVGGHEKRILSREEAMRKAWLFVPVLGALLGNAAGRPVDVEKEKARLLELH